MRASIIADTGGLLRALANGPDGRPAWFDFARVLTEAGEVIVPALVLAEVDYFLKDRREAMRRLVADLLDPETTYELEPVLASDLARAVELDGKFADLGLGLVDAMVAAVAERRQVYRVLSTDRGDLGAVRVGLHYRQPLVLLP
ncbi:MAG: type II toxin-antitoxin system VapC family toxin [Candidatus Riflebacteria bacterium]|nr:type II toxin-antitoxin system VapC family toxin [Candidatus Riflebacteria bacterium]